MEQPGARDARSNDDAAAHVFRLTLRLSTETLAEAAGALQALGLEPKAFFVLDGIEERPYPAELARHLSMPKPTISAYLAGLEKQGLIARAIDPADQRRHRLTLTAAGQSVLVQARGDLFARYEARLARLDPGDQIRFADLLAAIIG
jgi:DNA-binding MarR family transcriptional regulator